MNRIYRSTLVGMLLMVVAVTVIPYASAAPDHSLTITPSVGSPSTTPFELKMDVIPASLSDIVMSRLMVVFDPNNDFLAPSNPNDCETLSPESGDRMWVLRDAANTFDIGARHLATFESTLIADTFFGSGVDADIVDADPNADFTNADTAAISPAEPYQWKEINGLGAITNDPDDTSEVGLYKFLSCGFIDTNSNLLFDEGLPNVIAEPFRVIVVGGEILGADTAALLVAGALANTYWVLPALGGIAGAVVGIMKVFRRRSYKHQ